MPRVAENHVDSPVWFKEYPLTKESPSEFEERRGANPLSKYGKNLESHHTCLKNGLWPLLLGYLAIQEVSGSGAQP